MVVMYITHRIHPEYVDQYLEATLANAQATRQEPGNIRFDLLRDADDSCCFFLYEAYLNREAQQAHLSSTHFTTWKETVQDMFSGRSIQRLDAIHVP